MNKTFILLCIILLHIQAQSQNSFNIYPVVGENFQLDLGQYFNQYQQLNTVSILDQSVPFTLKSFGTLLVNDATIINGNIISTAQGSSYGNPNLPNNRYSYLVEESGYQLYEGELQQDGQLTLSLVSSQFNPPNTTCYTTEYLSTSSDFNVIAGSICLTDIEQSVSTIEILVTTLNNETKYLDTNILNAFTRNNVQQIQTQVTVSQYGKSYLSVFYILNNAQNNILQLFQIIPPQGQNIYPTLQIVSNSLSTNYTLVNYYLATDLSFFLLQSDSLIVVNATDYQLLGNVNIFIDSNCKNLGVYETSTTTQNQLVYVAVVGSYFITYYTYLNQQFTVAYVFYQENVNTTLIQNIFITPYTTVVIQQNKSIAFTLQIQHAQSSAPEVSQVWVEGIQNDELTTSLATFDTYNNILVWTLNNGTIYTVQFESYQLKTTTPLISTTPNGNFTIVGITEQGPKSVNFNYFVVADSNQAAIYQTQQTGIVVAQFYAQTFYQPFDYFTGPNLNYSQVYTSSNLYQSNLYQWSAVNISANVQNATFIKNFFLRNKFIQLYQINNGSIFTFAYNCVNGFTEFICQAPYQIDLIDQQIQQVFITNMNSYDVLTVSYQSSSQIQQFKFNLDENQIIVTHLATIDISTYFQVIQLGVTVQSIAIVYNNLYVVTKLPSSLIAIQIDQNYNSKLIANTSLQFYAPQNIWVNQSQFGELIMIDNIYELVILQLVDQKFFVQVSSIEFPIQNYDSLTLGGVYDGFFLTFIRNNESNIYFYPYNNIKTISFNGYGYTTKPGSFNYTIDSSIAASSGYYYYQVENKTLLVYQYSQSSVGSLYTTYTFSLIIKYISVVPSGYLNYFLFPSQYSLNDIITVILEDGSIQTLNLIYTPSIQATVSFNNQYLIQTGQFYYDITSNNLKSQTIKTNAIIINFENNQTVSFNTSSTGQQLKLNQTSQLNDNLLTWTFQYYPYPDFTGPIGDIKAYYNSTDTQINLNSITTYINMVQLYNLSDLGNSASFYYSQQNGVIGQNQKGSYIINSNNLNEIKTQILFTFPDEVISCPYVGQYNTSLYLSVCTLQNITNVIYVYNQTFQLSIQLINITDVIFTAIYQYGILSLSTSKNASVCALNLNTTQQVYCEYAIAYDIYDVPQIQVIQIQNGSLNINNLTQSFGIFHAEKVKYQFVLVGVNDQTVDENLAVQFTFTDETVALQDQVESIYAIYYQYHYELQIYSMIQTSNTNILNSQAQVPLFLWSNYNKFGLLLEFNISNILTPTLTNAVLQCGYIDQQGYLGTSAVNDLIVSAYQDGQKVNFISYRSSNTLFGGNGSSVCATKGDNIQLNQYLGSAQYQNESSVVSLLTLLENGQGFTVINNLTYLIQLSPAYQLTGQLNNQYVNQKIPVVINASNTDKFVTNTFTLYVIEEENNQQEGFNYKLFWIIFGSVVGVLVIIGIVAYVVHLKKRQNKDNLLGKTSEIQQYE